MLGLLICSLSCQKIEQKIVAKTEQRIDNIAFSFHHSRRVPFATVDVKISRNATNEAWINVDCKPMYNNRKWDYSNIDTSFNINPQTFDSIALMTDWLKKINLDSAYVNGARDGYTCSIKFGAKGKNTSYSFWTPGYETTTRGLTEFTTLCEEIIKVAGLNKYDILD